MDIQAIRIRRRYKLMSFTIGLIGAIVGALAGIPISICMCIVLAKSDEKIKKERFTL